MSGRLFGDQRGMAMLLALVLLAVASGLLLSLTGLGRSAVGTVTTAVARAENAVFVESALQATIAELFDEASAERLRERALIRDISVGGETVPVRIGDICGRWDLNRGDLDVFRELLNVLGVEPERSAAITGLLHEARQARDPFVDVSQLLVLPGLPEESKVRLRAMATVYCRGDLVALDHAAPELAAAVAQAEKLGGRRLAGSGTGRTWHLSAERANGPGTLVVVEAVIALSHDRRRPFRILEWRSSE